MKHLLTTIVALVATLTAVSVTAEPLLLGGKLGLNYSELLAPTDPQGEPTVLFGTAFSGFGFQVGGSARYEVAQLAFSDLIASADLMFAYQRGRGFAESRVTDARRTVAFHSLGLQLPVLVGLSFSGEGERPSKFDIAVGPSLLAGLSAGSSTKSTGDTEEAPALPVRPVTHVGLTAHAGVVLDIGDAWLPVDVRLTWNPMVAKSTRDRFDNFVSLDEPGRYAAAFSWSLSVSVGYLIDLGKDE